MGELDSLAGVLGSIVTAGPSMAIADRPARIAANMSETYWRFHSSGTPEFNAEHAYSGLWGSDWSTDGSQTRCRQCVNGRLAVPEYETCRNCYSGAIECDRCDLGGLTDVCRDCDGTGWQDALDGYSACDSREELHGYFVTQRSMSFEDADGEVIEFEGRYVGAGFDGEALVIPTHVVRRMTWNDFLEEM